MTAEQNEKDIEDYFHQLFKFRTLPAHRVFAGDETGFNFGIDNNSRKNKVLSPIGAKRVRDMDDSYTAHLSLLHICNAAGDSLPPIIIHEGKLLDIYMAEQVFDWNPDILFAPQENGYFIAEHFITVLQHLHKHIQPAPTESDPVLFIIDGCKAHLSIEALEFAESHNIHILCLPPHTSHILQVDDLSVFGPLKIAWRQACYNKKESRWRSTAEDAWDDIKKKDIIPLLHEAWDNSITFQNIRAGFKKAGIRPFNPRIYKTSLHEEDIICNCPVHDSLSTSTRNTLQYSRLLQSFFTRPHVQQLLMSSQSASLSMSVICHNDNNHNNNNTVNNAPKKKLKVTPGLLLTAEESIKQYKAIELAKKEEEARKAERRIIAAERKREREETVRQREEKKKRKGQDKKEPLVTEEKEASLNIIAPSYSISSTINASIVASLRPSDTAAYHNRVDDHKMDDNDDNNDKENNPSIINQAHPISSLTRHNNSNTRDKKEKNLFKKYEFSNTRGSKIILRAI